MDSNVSGGGVFPAFAGDGRVRTKLPPALAPGSYTSRMRRSVGVVLAFALLLLLTACGAGSGGDDWETLSSGQGRFIADFPVEPTRQTQRVPAVGEALNLVVYSAESKGEALSVSYIDYPTEPTTEQVEGALDAAAEGAASALQGQNLTKSSSTFHNREAIDFTMETDLQAITGKAFYVGPRMYVLQLVRAKSVESESFQRLVGSFSLVAGATPRPAEPLTP